MNPIIISKQQLKSLFKIASTEDIVDFVNNNNIIYPKPKYNGEIRFIHSPSDHLKTIQRWIVDNILSQKLVSDVAHAYCPEKSIFTNAKIHIGSNIVLKMDINSFFDSIPIEKVKGIFLSLGYNLEVSHSLAEFCTNKGFVRQGFSSSPIISNIILKEFDDELEKILSQSSYSRYGFRYSRYADDITISSVHKVVDEMKTIEQSIVELLGKNGFLVNNNKTKLIIGSGPKKITGIVVKESSVSVPNRYKKKLLQELYYCKKIGVTSHLIYTGNYGRMNYIAHLKGIATFIKNTDAEFYDKMIDEILTLDIES